MVTLNYPTNLDSSSENNHRHHKPVVAPTFYIPEHEPPASRQTNPAPFQEVPAQTLTPPANPPITPQIPAPRYVPLDDPPPKKRSVLPAFLLFLVTATVVLAGGYWAIEESKLPLSFEVFESVKELSKSKVAEIPKLIQNPFQNAGSSEPSPTPSTPIVSSNPQFAFDLFAATSAINPQNNLFLSPTSLKFALSLALEGASASTAAEIESVLGQSVAGIRLSSEMMNRTVKQASSSSLTIANSAWVDNRLTLNPSYQERLKNFYGVETFKVSFGAPTAATQINKWVSDTTNQKIPSIVTTTRKDQSVILVNTIYFKGNWLLPFDQARTTNRNFTNANGQTRVVAMMNRNFTKGDGSKYLENENMQLVRLPYKNIPSLSMVVILPKKPLRENFESLNTTATLERIKEAVPSEGQLRMPKFEMRSDLELKQVFSNLGIKKAFSDTADFSQMIEGGVNVKIDEILHKSFIEVNELGTEAAAASAVTMVTTSFQEPAKDAYYMEINKPFYFLMYDDLSQEILFLGRVNAL